MLCGGHNTWFLGSLQDRLVLPYITFTREKHFN